MRIDTFEMERMQSLYWHLVEYDLSESGVTPSRSRSSSASSPTRRRSSDRPRLSPLGGLRGRPRTHRAVVSRMPRENVTIVNGGTEANFLTLLTLLEPGDRLAFMVPNYMQGRGLGRHFAGRTDTFELRLGGNEPRWAGSGRAGAGGHRRRGSSWSATRTTPPGTCLTAAEMDAIVEAADRVGAGSWRTRSTAGRRSTRRDVADLLGSLRQRGHHERALEGVRMPGLRIGWAVAPEETIRDLWVRHDYTTLTPGKSGPRSPRGDGARAGANGSSPERGRSFAASSAGSRTGSIPTTTCSDTRGRGGRDRVRGLRPAASSRADRPDPEEQSVLLVPGDRSGSRGDSVRIRLRHRAHDEGTRPGGRGPRRVSLTTP